MRIFGDLNDETRGFCWSVTRGDGKNVADDVIRIFIKVQEIVAELVQIVSVLFQERRELREVSALQGNDGLEFLVRCVLWKDTK